MDKLSPILAYEQEISPDRVLEYKTESEQMS